MDTNLALPTALRSDSDEPILRLIHAWLRETNNATTAASKRTDLACFASFLDLPSPKDSTSLCVATRRLIAHGFGQAQELVRNWIAWMDERYSAKTRCRRVSHIRGLVRVAGEFGLPWQLRIRVRSAPTRELRGPDPDLVYRRISALASLDDPSSIRDTAVLVVFITLGVRRQAVVGLKLGDYRPGSAEFGPLRAGSTHGTLSLVGKNEDETHSRSLPPVASAAIDRWLVVRGTRPGFLFCSLRALRSDVELLPALAPSSIYRLCLRRGLGRPHGLRHSSATKLARDGYDAWALAAHLRHKNRSTVDVYVDDAANVPGQTAAHLAEPLEGLFDAT